MWLMHKNSGSKNWFVKETLLKLGTAPSVILIKLIFSLKKNVCFGWKCFNCVTLGQWGQTEICLWPKKKKKKSRDIFIKRIQQQKNVNVLTQWHCYIQLAMLAVFFSCWCYLRLNFTVYKQKRSRSEVTASVLLEKPLIGNVGFTHTIHIPVMMKTGRLRGRTDHRDMVTSWRAPLQTACFSKQVKR